ncbi:MAG: hypothetical protein EXR86_13340 [Gammaproteobacteria bacterium]|nr:hypothetical protein [Gammaproteobacteria bacterium]
MSPIRETWSWLYELSNKMNHGKRVGLTRLAPMLAGCLIVAGSLYVISDADNDIVGTRPAMATVLAVRQPRPGSPTGVGVVEVQLADGGRAKLFLSQPLPAPKARIPVTVTDYADGKRKVTAEE